MTAPRVFSAKDGLGNRLRALVGCRALACLEQVPLYVHWESDGPCAARFDELFAPTNWENVRFIDAEEAARFQSSNPDRFHHTSAWFTDIWEQHGQHLATREEFCRIAVSYLRSLRPQISLQTRIDEFTQKYNLASCIGIHIRMTDNVYSYEWWTQNDPDFRTEKVSQLDGFITLIEQFEKCGEGVLLTTDNADVAKLLCARYTNVFTYQKDYDNRGFIHHVSIKYSQPSGLTQLFKRIISLLKRPDPVTWRTTGVDDALIDLWLLSRCRRIVGSYYSSFSQVSAILGNVPLDRMEGIMSVENTFIRKLMELDVASVCNATHNNTQI